MFIGGEWVGAVSGTSFQLNTIHAYGLDTGVIRLAEYHGLVTEGISAGAEELEQKIITGQIEVSSINEPTQQRSPERTEALDRARVARTSVTMDASYLAREFVPSQASLLSWPR